MNVVMHEHEDIFSSSSRHSLDIVMARQLQLRSIITSRSRSTAIQILTVSLRLLVLELMEYYYHYQYL